MTQKEQLIAMLEHAKEDFSISAGTKVRVHGVTFVFHIDESLKEVEGVEYENY